MREGAPVTQLTQQEQHFIALIESMGQQLD